MPVQTKCRSEPIVAAEITLEPREKSPINAMIPELEFVRTDFIRRMEFEIHANRESGKGDWNSWQPDKLLLVSEMNWHLAKLIQAIKDGDAKKVSEYSADIANYTMKAEEIYGETVKMPARRHS